MKSNEQSKTLVQNRDLPVWLCLGAPIASLLICWLTPLLGYDLWFALVGRKEISFIEIGTVAFLLPAVVIGVILFFRFIRNHNPSLPRRQAVAVAVFVAMLTIAALYFAGEEISWGQTYLQFDTPESLASINRQKEFNLHNIELLQYGPWVDLLDDLFSNVPRQMLLLATILGIVLPIATTRWRRKEGARNSFWYWLIPTWPLVPICLVAALSTVPEKIANFAESQGMHIARDGYLDMAFVSPGGEFKEYCFGLVILFYLLSLLLRTSNKREVIEAAGLG